ncbi:O-antigen ligase family protein [Rhodopseudomonas sp. NSM]|uniref:O-antigen ligase family protein n=1 Tax=Rhodopseudomonas sp. NSM TaxID=3457630 RepID=UPI00403643B4
MKRTATLAPHRIERSLPSAAGQVGTAAQMRRGQKPSALVPLFIFSLALPFFFFIGPTRMSPYRLVLVVMFLPCLMAWLSGSLGRPRLPDILMLLTATWGGIVLVSTHGTDKGLQSAGIFIIETFGAYLLARRYIRDAAAFQQMVRYLAVMVIVLLPFAVYENVTGSAILIELFGKMFSVYDVVGDESRLGLRRAQGPFEHFILFGVVCSSAFGLSYYAYGAASRFRGKLASGLVAMAVFSSLSSGALLSVAVQVILIVWDKITASMARRWAIFATILITAFVVVDFASNRTPFEVFISYLTFNADTSYMRVLIWHYGTESVMLHPILGHGLNDWERPTWMGGSIDNFWLVNAVRYGIPGCLFMIGSFIALCLGLGRLKRLSVQAAQCRKGLIITLCGLALSLCTVHVWDAPYVLIMFLLGAGGWMYDCNNEAPVAASAAQNAHRHRGAHAAAMAKPFHGRGMRSPRTS